MINFDLVTNSEHGRVVYWLESTVCTGQDAEHTCEIYEQLDAELVFNL